MKIGENEIKEIDIVAEGSEARREGENADCRMQCSSG